jgi:hypothetical protein
MRRLLCALLFALTVSVPARADEVLDWHQFMFEAARTTVPAASPLNMSRFAAIVSASVYDAVNGIERRYTPVHVAAEAPPGSSRRAAAVQAAYAQLIRIFPSQAAALDAHRADSLAAIASEAAVENSQSIARGLAWGQAVADAIWAWRSTDGFTPAPPPFLGGNAPGEWRPTPPAFAPGAGPQFATMVSWVIASHSQFRPAGPPALFGLDYYNDVNEVKTMGRSTSLDRSPAQTFSALFWASASNNYLWNSAAAGLSTARHLTLSENARLFGLLNVAIADAAIACWDAKYWYVFWRPITAIQLDPDPTVRDPSWVPLLPTPAHPDYPSGHCTASGGAAGALASMFGDATPFTMASDGSGQPGGTGPNVPSFAGQTLSFASFSAALADVKDARINGGIHFRTACNDGSNVGMQVAAYIVANAFLPVNGNHTGQIRK